MAGELSPNVSLVADQVTQVTLQTGQQVHAIGMQNAVALQQNANNLSLAILTNAIQIANSYAGNHLRRGSEVDVQEAVSEGAVYKGEGQASFPQQAQQLDSLYHKDALKGVIDAVVSQVLAKLAQSTPPVSGAYSVPAQGN